MDFVVGDWVEVLDESIRGKVREIKGSTVTIITEEGFPLQYETSELILVKSEIRVSNFEAAQIKAQKDSPKRQFRKRTKTKERNAPKMEVDLHIHQLVKSTKGMTKFDMLNVQLETAKRRLDFAISKRIQKIVFIHGVGEGVLKEELKYLFKKYDNLKFYDADYQKYGLGATEVYIFQNS